MAIVRVGPLFFGRQLLKNRMTAASRAAVVTAANFNETFICGATLAGMPERFKGSMQLARFAVESGSRTQIAAGTHGSGVLSENQDWQRARRRARQRRAYRFHARRTRRF